MRPLQLGRQPPLSPSGRAVSNSIARLVMTFRYTQTLRILVTAMIMVFLANAVCVGTLLTIAERSVKAMPSGITTLVVLFGDSNKMEETTLRSLRRALAIASPNTGFICIGGARPDIHYSGAYEMRDWLSGQGIDQSRIRVGTNSFDSVGNLAELKRLNIGPESIGGPTIIVADSLHALRIRTLFADNLGSNVLVPGYRLVDGSFPSLLMGLQRSQYELIAWGLYIALPQSWYQSLVKRLRRNAHE